MIENALEYSLHMKLSTKLHRSDVVTWLHGEFTLHRGIKNRRTCGSPNLFSRSRNWRLWNPDEVFKNVLQSPTTLSSSGIRWR